MSKQKRRTRGNDDFNARKAEKLLMEATTLKVKTELASQQLLQLALLETLAILDEIHTNIKDDKEQT